MSEASRTSGPTHRGRVGTVVNGKWRIDERIGSGGMSSVYAATGPSGERVALKMLHSQLGRDADVRARFLREAYVANVVSHPGIVRVLGDDVSEDGAVYLVLELLMGETLEALRVGAQGALPFEEVLDVADQVLDALAAAHARDIIHRDVKPENVFVTTDGLVKVLDFGLARMRGGRHETTKTGVTIGTPEFMPPEQAGGRRDGVDVRSDVWGVGAMIFTSVTGHFVHEAPTLHETLVAAATQRARPLRQLLPDVPDRLASVVDRALELEKQDRWASALEMQRALRAARGRTLQMVRAPRQASETDLQLRVPNEDVGDGYGHLDAAVDEDGPTIHRIAPRSVPQPSQEDAPLREDRMTTQSLPKPTMPLGAMMAAGETLAIDAASSGRTLAAPASTARHHGYAQPQPHAMAPSADGSGPVQSVRNPHVFVGHGPPSVMPPPPMSLPPSRLPEPRGASRTLVAVTVFLVVILTAFGGYVMYRRGLRSDVPMAPSDHAHV